MTLPKIAVKRPIGTAMVFVAVMVFGAVSLSRLPVDLMPSVDFPRISVTTLYEGVAPQEMETLITRPIEQTLSTIDGVDEITATSAEGISRVALQFDWGTNLDTAVNDVRANLDRLANRLPEDADAPIVWKFDLSSISVASFGLSGKGDVRQLRYLAEEVLARRIERVSGVASVRVRGGRVREIYVYLDAARLAAMDITARQVSEALARENHNVSAGSMLDTGRDVIIRSVGEFDDMADIERTVVATREGRAIYVDDVADVVDGFQELESELWINGEPGIRLRISKQDGANTVAVVERLQREVQAINRDYEGQLELVMLWNGAEYIEASITNVRDSALIGAGLAVLVLLVFLRSGRATMVIATAIPVSILATFALMNLFGFSLNTISFGGIALGIGMLVDNSIVVLENIYRKREEGDSATDAAVAGASEVGTAISASTMTTLVVFAPVLFIAGFAGVFFKEMAGVVVFALLCSLVVAISLVPALAAKLVKRPPSQKTEKKSLLGRGLDALDRGYSRIIGRALSRPWLVIAVMCAGLGGAIFCARFVDTELLPRTDEGRLDVSVQLPVGTPIETTMVAMQDMEARVREVLREDELETLVTVAGPEAFWRPGGSNQGSMSINLSPVTERARSIVEIQRAVQSALANIPAARVQVRASSSNFLLRLMRGGGDRLTVEIRGHDLDTAAALTRQVEAAMRQVDGVTFVKADREDGALERLVYPRPDRLAELSLTPADVANAIEHYVLGYVATRFRDGSEEVDVRVRLREADREHIERLAGLPILGKEGSVVRLDQVVRIEKSQGPTSISREAQERVVSVFGGTAGRPFGDIVEDVRERLQSITVPDGFSIGLGGEVEEQQETFSGLLVGIALAIFLVYAVMVIQFESLVHPLIVMASVPFSAIGVIAMLLGAGISFNMNSFLGAIVLVGIVVNNAIVLVDYINFMRRDRGVPLREAVIETARRRLRPILMTTFTTSLGMLPIALGIGQGSELQVPLAAVVIGGLLAGTTVTLFLIPSLYFIVERRRTHALIPS